MAKTKVLITVKTYPTISSKYDELVCTAGFREDGTWVRIYPVQFRKLDYKKQYSRYFWVEIDLEPSDSDFRPESFKPHSLDTIPTILEKVGTENFWKKRREICLKKVYDNLTILISEAKDKTICTSLATFKPTKIIDFVCEEVEREWDKQKIDAMKQINLFETQKNGNFKVVDKLPYKFSYIFEDVEGTRSKLMIEDWETGALYWNCLKAAEGNEKIACEKVRQRYFDDFAKTKDLYFFLGTTKLHHFTAKNPFIIIGTFHAMIDNTPKNPSLF